MILTVKVIPKSSQNQIMGWEGETLRVKVKGVPEDNEVNNNLIDYLAAFFSIPKTSLTLVSGRTSRIKRVSISEECSHSVKSKLMLII